MYMYDEDVIKLLSEVKAKIKDCKSSDKKTLEELHQRVDNIVEVVDKIFEIVECLSEIEFRLN